MSEPAPKQRRPWQLYVKDMLEFAERVVEYTDGFDFEQFVADRRTYDATLRNLELIGEAATKVPTEIREQYPDIPWRLIIATRNRLIHGYLGIDDATVWNIVEAKVPELQGALRAIPE